MTKPVGALGVEPVRPFPHRLRMVFLRTPTQQDRQSQYAVFVEQGVRDITGASDVSDYDEQTEEAAFGPASRESVVS